MTLTPALAIHAETVGVTLTSDPRRQTLTITASQEYIRLLTQLICQGIDLWDESELTG